MTSNSMSAGWDGSVSAGWDGLGGSGVRHRGKEGVSGPPRAFPTPSRPNPTSYLDGNGVGQKGLEWLDIGGLSHLGRGKGVREKAERETRASANLHVQVPHPSTLTFGLYLAGTGLGDHGGLLLRRLGHLGRGRGG